MAIQDNIFYREEHVWLKEAFDYKLTNFAATIICNKISRKFKINCVIHKFRGNRQSGTAYYQHINVSHNPTLGLLIHEIAHIYNNQHDLRLAAHDYRLKESMIKIFDYCKLKNFWKNEDFILGALSDRRSK